MAKCPTSALPEQCLSSDGHRAYLGEEVIRWLSTDWVLGQFGRRLGEARRRYGEFVREGVGEGYGEEFHRGSEDSRVMGNEEFVQGVLDRLDQRIGAAPTLEKIVRTVCQVYGLKETELRGSGQRRVPSEVRAVVGWLAMEYGSATLSEVGRRFNRDVTTMCSAVRRLIGRERDLRVLRDRMAGAQVEGSLDVAILQA